METELWDKDVGNTFLMKTALLHNIKHIESFIKFNDDVQSSVRKEGKTETL